MGMASQKVFFEPVTVAYAAQGRGTTSYNVLAATSLVTLLIIVRRKFATTIRNQAISSKTVGYGLIIATLKLFKLLSRLHLLCLPL